jgi:hypothetical protein
MLTKRDFVPIETGSRPDSFMGGTSADVPETGLETKAEFEDMDSPWAKGERGCENLFSSLTKRKSRCNAP